MCVQAQGRSDPHRTEARDAGEEVPVLAWDYGHLCGQCATDASEKAAVDRDAEAQGWSPLLSMRDRNSAGIYPYFLPAKGVDFPALDTVLDLIVGDLDRLGYRRVTFRSDGEPSILAFLRTLKLSWKGEVIPEASATGDPSLTVALRGAWELLKE